MAPEAQCNVASGLVYFYGISRVVRRKWPPDGIYICLVPYQYSVPRVVVPAGSVLTTVAINQPAARTRLGLEVAVARQGRKKRCNVHL